MNIITIIPARGGSKGIPGKNIMPIAGQPLISWSIEQSINTNLISHTFVTTDDKEISEISKSYGAEIIPRPVELAGDKASSESALQHAIEFINSHFKIFPDLIVFLQPTSPLRKKDDIKNCIEKFYADGCDSLFSASILEDFLIWEKNDKVLKSINYDYKNRGIRQNRKPQYVENGSIYLFKPDVLFKYNNRFGENLSMYEMDFWQTWEIDNYDDIPLVEFYLTTRIKPQLKRKIQKIDLIIYDFDGIMTDNKAYVNEDGNESVKINRSDGWAVNLIKGLNIPQIIVSTEPNKVVAKRAEKLNLKYFHNIKDKKLLILDIMEKMKVDPKNTVYLGNDVNDMEAMKIVGYPICPKDAREEIKNISIFILDVKGGDGVIRELYESLLKGYNHA